VRKDLNSHMTEYTDEPLVSRDVSIRREQNRQLKINQQKEMENRRIAAPKSAWNQSVSASTDIYMRDALTQVRKSSTTLPTELTMRMGTYIYTNK
jgi:hypothetical protein